MCWLHRAQCDAAEGYFCPSSADGSDATRHSHCRKVPSCTATFQSGTMPRTAKHRTTACDGGAALPASSCPVSQQALREASGGPHREPDVLRFLMPEPWEISPSRVPSSATTSVTPYLAFRPWIQSFLSVVFECLVLPVCVVFVRLQENHLCTEVAVPWVVDGYLTSTKTLSSHHVCIFCTAEGTKEVI